MKDDKVIKFSPEKTETTKTELDNIKKSLYNLICEAQDISDKFDFNNQKSAVISTTTMCHLFGLTFHLMVPLCNGLIINTQNISYPEICY